MATLQAAVEWIANNDDADIGKDDDGYIISVYLVADLFGRSPNEIAWAVMTERQGMSWRLGRRSKARAS